MGLQFHSSHFQLVVQYLCHEYVIQPINLQKKELTIILINYEMRRHSLPLAVVEDLVSLIWIGKKSIHPYPIHPNPYYLQIGTVL